MKIELSEKQSEAWQYLEDDTTRIILYGGAAGGGKSLLLCLWHIYRRIKYPRTRGLIGRAKLTALEQSTLITYFKACEMMGYKMNVHYSYNQQKHVIHWLNGSVTILKDLFLYPSDPEFTSLGSTEFTDVCIDEVTECSEKVYEILRSRIRWMLKEYNLIPKLLMTCNPSPGWVKDRFVSDDYGKPVILNKKTKFVRAFVTDNPDKEFVRLYQEQLNELNDYDRQRLLFGDWEAKKIIKNPFAFNFTNEMIRSDIAFDEKRQLYLSFDFNVDPFVCTAYQIFYKNNQEHCHAVDEIILSNGSIPDMAVELKKRYGRALLTCRITGDYSGKKRDLSQKDTAHYYTQLQRELNISPAQIITPVNPSHKKSRQDVNYFLKHYKNFFISDKLKSLIFDLRNVECDNTGKIIKESRDKREQRSDALDSFRYFINTFLYAWIVKHQKLNRI